MDVLAGRKSIGRFSGTRLLDNRPIDEKSLKQRSAYVSQDDVFHPTATVGEAVLFQANLR
jgi:ABC-type multidrug transport system ATPase subunit